MYPRRFAFLNPVPAHPWCCCAIAKDEGAGTTGQSENKQSRFDWLLESLEFTDSLPRSQIKTSTLRDPRVPGRDPVHFLEYYKMHNGSAVSSELYIVDRTTGALDLSLNTYLKFQPLTMDGLLASPCDGNTGLHKLVFLRRLHQPTDTEESPVHKVSVLVERIDGVAATAVLRAVEVSRAALRSTENSQNAQDTSKSCSSLRSYRLTKSRMNAAHVNKDVEMDVGKENLLPKTSPNVGASGNKCSNVCASPSSPDSSTPVQPTKLVGSKRRKSSHPRRISPIQNTNPDPMDVYEFKEDMEQNIEAKRTRVERTKPKVGVRVKFVNNTYESYLL